MHTDIAVRSLTCNTATGTLLTCHIGSHSVRAYLPPTGDIPAFTTEEAGTRLSDPGGMQG